MRGLSKNHCRQRNAAWLAQTDGCRLETLNYVTRDRLPQQHACKEENALDEWQHDAAQNEPVVNMPVISSVVGAPNIDPLHLLSYKPHKDESQDQKGDKHEDSRSTCETSVKKRQHKRRSYTDEEYKPINHKEEMDPQRRLLDIALKPEIRLHRIELAQQHVCEEEMENLTDQQLCNQESNTRMDQEKPGPCQIKLEQEELSFSREGQQLLVKRETDTSLLIPTYEESDHSEDKTLHAAQNEPVVNMPVISSVVGAPIIDPLLLLSNKPHKDESQDQKSDKHEDCRSTWETSVKKRQNKRRSYTDEEYKPTNHKEEDPQRRLLDIALKPEIRLHRIEFPLEHVCKEEKEDLIDQQLFNQERNSTMEQEEPEILQIKQEQIDLWTRQEVEQRVVKQETDTFMLTPSFEENKYSDNQTLYFNLNENLNTAQKESLVNLPIISCVVGKPNSDLLLPFNSSGVVECQGTKGDACEKYSNLKAKLQCKTNSSERPYICKICGKGFRLNGELTAHIRIHLDEKPLVCKAYGRSFRYKGQLMDHMRIHTGERPYLCKTCGRGFRFKGQLSDHMRIHTGERPYLCKTCGRGFRLKSLLKAHIRIHSDERPHVCKTCGKGFKSKSALAQHMRIHTGGRPHVCNTCEKGFRLRSELTVHMRIHSDVKPFVCKTCGKGFRLKVELRFHMGIHTDEKSYVCKICGLGCRTKMLLTDHIRIHTDEKPYVCETCGQGFRSARTLTQHIRIHTGERPCVCKTCGQGFRSSSTLAGHIRIHTDEKPFVCKTCGKRFRRNPDLKTHMSVHSDVKPFVCKICGNGFRYKTVLTHHMMTHSDEKPFVCGTCGQGFRSARTLTQHIRIHTGERPCVCQTCGQGFRSSSTLAGHIRIHTDERPFVCKTCGKRFRRNPDLTTHMSVHSDVKPFVCKICGSGFRYKTVLTHHMMTHSDEKPFVCETTGKDFCGEDIRQNGHLITYMINTPAFTGLLENTAALCLNW